ncbi:MAG: hypothetical protein JO252_25080 [Planctomycetaceae bacterium]|nr:hypothetical protein [Planctomycetaceae bacterium]
MVSANPGGLLLLGRGKVAPLGQVDLVGTLSSRSAEPTTYDGTVMLFNSLGGINVHIFGIVGGPSGPPAHLHYDILEGFGAFQGATGNGNVVYVQNPPMNDRTPFLLTFS